MPNKILNTLLYILILFLLNACADLEAKKYADLAIKDLKTCNFNDASKNFNKASKYRPHDDDLNFAKTITAIFNTLNTPQITDLQKKLALNNPQYLFKSNGLLDILTNRKNIGDLKQLLQNNAINCQNTWHTCIDPSLTLQYIHQQLADTFSKLSKNADELVKIAHTTNKPIKIKDLCGLEPFYIHKADLYTLAALIHLIHALLYTLNAYDLEINFSKLIQTIKEDSPTTEYQNHINNHLFILKNTPNPQSNIDNAIKYTQQAIHAFSLAFDTIHQYKEQQGDPKQTLFNWKLFSITVIEDLQTLAQILSNALNTQKPVPLDTLIISKTNLDLLKLIISPPHRNTDNPLLTIEDNDKHWDLNPILQHLVNAFSPPIFNLNNNTIKINKDVEFRISSGWKKIFK